MRLIDVNAFERPGSVYLDEGARAVPCAVMRPGRNHDVRSRLEFVALPIHGKTERAGEYSNVFVVPVPM